MPDTITGRIVGLSDPDAHQLVVNVRESDTAQPFAPSSHVDRDGRFRLTLSRPISGRASLYVADEQGLRTEIELGDAPTMGEIIVVLPEPPKDVRDYVTNVTETIQAEREALKVAKEVLSAEVNEQFSRNSSVNDVVNSVLAQISESGGGDLQWKVKGNQSIRSLTEKAVTASYVAVDSNSPAIVAKTDTVTDGEELSTQDLVSRLSGGRTHRNGFWRDDPIIRLKQRDENSTSDGLPRPIYQEYNNSNTEEIEDLYCSTSTEETITNAVKSKVNELVNAIRLPEDPPLLVADSAIKGAGADVEFARGIADVTAFHDFHELVLAMPNVWQDVFDQRFKDLLRAALQEIAVAGVELEPLLGPSPNGENPVERILHRLHAVQNMYETTSAKRIRPLATSMITPAATAVADGVSDPSGRVIMRVKDDPDGGPGVDVDEAETSDIFAGEASNQEAKREPSNSRPALLPELVGYLDGKHSFTVFAANGAERAINFGLLLTWRQLWKPLSYQAGEIVHTMTLAPGEERTITTKQRRTFKRYTAEAQKAQRSRSLETIDTSRAESEILRKANASTNFELTSEGSTKLLVSDGSFTTTATRDVGREGNDTRRRFREAVMKASQEYREEHSMEVKTEAEDVFEEETTAKFRNPNDEIVLNAVFYSLQRRYQIQEHLYRARPVILVAMPVPDPSQITSAWLIRYAWIIRRALLDDRFTVALDYLTTSFLGDREVLIDLRNSVNEHTKALAEARHRLADARFLVETQVQNLQEARKRAASGDEQGVLDVLNNTGIPVISSAAGLVDSALGFVGGLLGGGSDEAEKREQAALIIEAAEDELLRAERQSREAETQVTAATSALQQATRDYVQAKRTALNHEIRIAELRVHVSDNILHYMQAIWASLPPDQLFFELHNVEVPILSGKVRVKDKDTFDQPGLSGFTQEQFSTEFVSPAGKLTFRSLAEVARLVPLGFKGNMIMFEMYEGNVLTDRILAPYLDADEVLRDPNDIAASWTLTELRQYADMLRAKVVDGEISQEDFDNIHAPFLRSTLKRLLTNPGPSEDVVIAPANSVFAELLITGDSLLEPFKQEHRALDVAIARSQLRENELNNTRRAVRIGTDDYEDPDIEAKYIFEGDGSATIVPPGSRGDR